MLTRRTLAACLPALPLLGRAPHAMAQPASTLDRVRSSRVLRYGVVAGQPPYSWRDPATSAWTGFMPDLAAELAATLGAIPQPHESTWGNAALDVQAGKADIFFCLAPTPQRAQVVDFTTPLYQNAFALAAREGFSPATWAAMDRPETRIALELGSVYDQNVGTLCPHATITRLRTNNEALLSVQSGRADCQLLVVILALTALSRNASLGHLVVPQPLFGSETAAMMPKEPGHAWQAMVDGWIGERRRTGHVRRVLVANLVKSGVAADLVPKQLLF